MQNIRAIINMDIFHQNNEIKYECNCRNKNYCPLGGIYLSPNMVYQGKITSSQRNYNDKVYFGVAEKSFKDSHSKIVQTHEEYANDTQITVERILGN